MKAILSLAFTFCGISVANAEGKPTPPPSFTNDVLPTLTRVGCNSGACHGALAGKGGFKLSLRGFDPEADHFAITRQALARRTDSDDAANSLLLKKATRSMPHGGGKRFEEDSPYYATLLAWIRAGAPAPQSKEITVTKLELSPKTSRVKPKDKFRVSVQAHYSDRSKREVTHLARFASTEDLVAGIDQDGNVSVTGYGEASLTANFGNRVATAVVTAPFPNKLSDVDFAVSPRSNFIDDHIAKKLKLLSLPPSAGCSDAEFIRRVYLDTCGLLPKPAEVKAFLDDTAKDKRAKLIDKLLDSTAYVDYWSHKWSDLLLVSSRRLSTPAVAAFYRFVRQNVADNTPWNSFARGILTAQGSSLSNGAVNYFVLHKDTAALFETTSITFMGLSMGCAKCHNHPLEKWTQDQYWATANLLSRVGVKNGDRAGEFTVQSVPSGDALHLRRGIAMPPTPFDGTPLADDAADRRVYFADWLTAQENPYFAKAIINRIWKNYLGRGLVEVEDDLRETNPPSNAELLDALAEDFIRNKYDMKHLMRQILNSAAYQRSAKPLPTNAADDRFYSRYLPRRLSAEVILDAYSDITGVASNFDVKSVGVTGGSEKTANFPLGTRAMQLPDSLLVSPFLTAFGRADREQTCACEVTKDSSVTQALHLNNGKTLNDKLRDPKSIVATWLKEKTDNDAIVKQLFQLSLCREPNAAETKALLATLAEATDDASRREVLEDLVWALLTSREFLFNR